MALTGMARGFCILFALGLTLADQANACCIASSGKPVWLTKEKVIIVWDAERKIEHFIRQASFDTKARDFGFIVPTPSVPELAVANPEAFTMIEGLVPPPTSIGCSSVSSATRRRTFREPAWDCRSPATTAGFTVAT